MHWGIKLPSKTTHQLFCHAPSQTSKLLKQTILFWQSTTNISVYELFLSLNISNFSYFLCKNCTLPHQKKAHLLFPSNPPLNIEILSNPPFKKFGSRPSPLQHKGQGKRGCTLIFKVHKSKSVNKILGKYMWRNSHFWELFCIYEQNLRYALVVHHS